MKVQTKQPTKNIEVFIKFLLLSLVFTLNSFATETISYYGETFYQRNYHRPGTKNKEELQNYLKKVQRGKHAKNGKFDLLVKNCPQNKRCYQHKFLKYSEEVRPLVMTVFNKRTDQQGQEYVETVYCHKRYKLLKRGNYYLMPKHQSFNVEHTVPKSKFPNKLVAPYNSIKKLEAFQKSDLHNLYPTVSKVNGLRANFPLRDIPGTKYQIRDCEISEYDRKSFEPPKEHKGNIARAYFYVSIQYGSFMSRKQIELYKRWNQMDRPDEREIIKNNNIFIAQKTRNPFIDYPHLANDAF